MQYQGGKERLSGKIVPILQEAASGSAYWEPFCGACSVISKVNARVKIASDSHKQLIILWAALQDGWTPPDFVTEDLYNRLRKDKDTSLDPLTAFVGFGCGFMGRYFEGFCRDAKGSNYALRAKRSLLKKLKGLRDTTFLWAGYGDNRFKAYPRKIIYCDPPYKGTKPYGGVAFDHAKFYNWCREMVSKGDRVFVSGYTEPTVEFKTVSEFPLKKACNGDGAQSILKMERLFEIKG